MRILLAANASYVPPRGGATRSNLVWMDHLAASGHECRIVAATLPDSRERLEQLQNEQMLEPKLAGAADGVEVGYRSTIAVYSAADPLRRSALLQEQVAEFRPDWVLVSSEDVGQMLLREAHRCSPGRVIYIAHTPQFFPFGPASWNLNPEGTELVRRSAGVVAISQFVADYIRRHAGCNPAVVHPPIYGSEPFEQCGSFDNPLVTMINPCAVKGISIFLELARALPEFRFGALPGWGTTRQDREALESLSNVNILPNCRNIEDVLRQTKILLMPSLWTEGFGLIVMEAMLRGVPVISSDAGGLLEAKRGTGFVIPVQSIERYEPVYDEHAMPKPVVAVHDTAPWVDALRTLSSDASVYRHEAEVSRDAALRFVCRLRAGEMEEYLLSLGQQPASPEVGGGTSMDPPLKQHRLESLSPEKRALLLQRLRKKGAPAGEDGG